MKVAKNDLGKKFTPNLCKSVTLFPLLSRLVKYSEKFCFDITQNSCSFETETLICNVREALTNSLKRLCEKLHS
jgi:hypothetical protein